MRLIDHLRDDFVLLRLASQGAEDIVHEVAARAGEVGIAPADLVEGRLMERERLHPTVMGSGLAIPHATVPGLEEPVIGIALAGEPVSFGAGGAEPVRVFFVLLSPPGGERAHVKLLARICRLVRHEGFMDRLESARDAKEIVRIIQSVDAQHV